MRATLSRRGLLRSLVLAPVAALAVGGLGALPAAASAADGVTVVNEGVTTGGAALWQGFDHRWRDHAHRVNRFGSALRNLSVQIGGAPAVALVRGDYQARMRYGDTNGGDIAAAAAYAAPLLVTDQPSALTAIHGSASVDLAGQRGVRAFLKADPLTQILPANVAATVVLRGFDIVCLNAPNEGFHTRGFGFRLGPIAVAQATSTSGIQLTKLTFAPEFMIWPDRSPDPFNVGPTSYTYRLTIYYTLLYAPVGRARFTETTYDTGELVGVDASAAPLRVLRSVGGQGGGAFPRSALGLRGFQFELPEHHGTANDGRYLRQLRFFVEPASYTPQTGAATYYANLHFTNKGGYSYDFDIRYLLDVTHLQYISPIGSSPSRLEQSIDPAANDLAVEPFTLGGYLAG
jgi:hypothetical protein